MLSRDWVARSGVEAHSADSGCIGATRDAIAIVIGRRQRPKRLLAASIKRR